MDHPGLYLFWDSTHPTTHLHQIFGNEAYLLGVPEPGSAGKAPNAPIRVEMSTQVQTS